MGAFILAIGLTIVSTFGFFTNIPSWQYIGTIANFVFPYIYRPQRSWGKVIFSEACVNNSVHGGVCMVARGGHAWLLGGACVVLFGGACMVLFGGVCVVLFGGHAWFYSGGCAWFYLGGQCAWFYSGAFVVLFRGVHGFIRGACMVLFRGEGMHGFIQWGACVVLFSRGVCVVLFSRGGVRGFFSFLDTMRYGQWAGSTHPTGMHSCCSFFLYLHHMTLVNVKLDISECKRRLQMSLVQFLSNGTAKTKLVILTFFVKNSNARNGSRNHPHSRSSWVNRCCDWTIRLVNSKIR